MDAAWHPRRPTCSPAPCPVTDVVTEALADHAPFRMQRVGGLRAGPARDDEVLLTRISARGFHTGSWTLPGGGLDHGEAPARRAGPRGARGVRASTCEVGDLLDVHDTHFSGTAPSGRFEDFHGVHLVFAATVPDGAEPRVVEVDGTTDAVGLGAARRDRRRRAARCSTSSMRRRRWPPTRPRLGR